ncbi:SpoIIE family protein phosphatase [Streptomyces sp. NA04227]|uniref:PP2C family protein-serine/threonine phosphatase n=1 Tax=Streptomyces sp. NA04227 TaxID=2742136 RepID=UPI0015902DD5|nr:PP2C family protein-serine/threonine phosphatase [Streptomyces sp. NA04227]QKW07908.1 SpoIIE family protein phosphatase [Streptomyces sp. NA04227]
MNAPRLPKVAGINSSDSRVPSPAHTAQPSDEHPAAEGSASPGSAGTAAPKSSAEALQDQLAGWVTDLTTLHEFTESLSRTATLDAALHEILRAGALLVGARRALIVVEPGDGTETTVGLGLGRADLGHIETVPRSATSYGRLLDTPAGLPGGEREIAHPDLLSEDDLDPRHREVAARLGYAASYALPLASESAGRVGAAVWLYDEPAEPSERQRHLIGLYARQATEHLARLLELERARAVTATLAAELLPPRLPRVASVQLAVRHRTGAHGGGDWYDALPLPEGALGLAVGSVTGSGPSAVAAMGRLRASLRAYAVMEGEDPVAVLSDLELLLRLTEPARSATALFAHCEPAVRRITLAGAGHSPPLIVGARRTEFVETSLSAPLGMLACWEAPSVEVNTEPGETLLLYTDGLLRRTGEPMDRAFARLHAAASGAARAVREDPEALTDHVLRTLLPEETDGAPAALGPDRPGPLDSPDRPGHPGHSEDVVLLAARFA